VQCSWTDAPAAGRGKPSVHLLVDEVQLRRGAAIGGRDAEETASLGQLLGRLISSSAATSKAAGRPAATPPGDTEASTSAATSQARLAQLRPSEGVGRERRRGRGGRGRGEHRPGGQPDQNGAAPVTIDPAVLDVASLFDLDLAAPPEDDTQVEGAEGS